VDHPFNPISLALGAEASFVARTMDSDRKHLTSVLREAVQHRGSALVEIYQNCPIFNDGAFDVLKDRESAAARLVHLEHGAPVRFGKDGENGIVRGPDGMLQVAPVDEVGTDALVVHDARNPDPSLQFAISRLDDPAMAHVPVGVFRRVERPTYDDLAREQIAEAKSAGGPATDEDLAKLLAGNDTWTVA
jgi:2-oxoglutarate ferredoxin oxidoreductase subunit beta